MKIYISADMEGISGVANPIQVYGGMEYEMARRLTTAEVNAAIAGAKKAGADEILVNDGHGSMRNLVVDMLDADARVIVGDRKKLCMMEGLDSSFDGVLMIGYHSRVGSSGVLSHSFIANGFSRILVNGRECGELEINAMIAGSFSVPVIMVSGDDVLKEQVNELQPGIRYAQVKETVSQLTALCLSPERACSLVSATAEEAVRNAGKIMPCPAVGPFDLSVELKSVSYAELMELIPGVSRNDAYSVSCRCADAAELMKMIYCMSLIIQAAMSEFK